MFAARDAKPATACRLEHAAEPAGLEAATKVRERELGRAIQESERGTYFEMENLWLSGEGRVLETAARCQHCRVLTRSVGVTSKQFHAEGGVSGEIKQAGGGTGGDAGAHPSPKPGETAGGGGAVPKVAEPLGTVPAREVSSVGEAGAAVRAARVAAGASRLRAAGRLLASEAPGLLLQLILMLIFPPKAHIHNDKYGALNAQKVDPALHRALRGQAAAFEKLATEDPRQSIWAAVSMKLDYHASAVVQGMSADLELNLDDMSFVDMKLTREYFLVEGQRFDVSGSAKPSKTITYSVPIFGPATQGSEEAIRNFRKVREDLEHSAYKARMSATIAMYRIADANPFLKSQLMRDLQKMLNDDEDTVREIAEGLLKHLHKETGR